MNNKIINLKLLDVIHGKLIGNYEYKIMLLRPISNTLLLRVSDTKAGFTYLMSVRKDFLKKKNNNNNVLLNTSN